MDEITYQNLLQYIEDIDGYQSEINLTDRFFREKGVDMKTLDEVFWNHLITLFKRVDAKEQNELEIENLEGISDEAKILLNQYIYQMKLIRPFELTEFETMLLTIYTQKMLKKGE